MNANARLRIPEEVLARKVGDETVLLHLGKGAYFGLDPVGTLAWSLIAGGATPAQVCDALVAEYDVARADAERDVAALISELAAQGLVEQT